LEIGNYFKAAIKISFISMEAYINWNGEIVNKDTFYVSPDNRGLKYGDGFF
jgi:hypothetical protein